MINSNLSRISHLFRYGHFVVEKRTFFLPSVHSTPSLKMLDCTRSPALPFIHSTSVTDDRRTGEWTTTVPIARPLLKYGRLTIKRIAERNWYERFPVQELPAYPINSNVKG